MDVTSLIERKLVSLLELADNDSPMSDTWRYEIEAPIRSLGIDNAATLQELIDTKDIIPERKYELARYRSKIYKIIGKYPGQCVLSEEPSAENELSAELEFPPGLAQNKITLAKYRYERYKKTCDEIKNHSKVYAKIKYGKLLTAKNAWEKAVAEETTRMEDVDEAKEEVKGLKESYKEAIDTANEADKKGDELRKEIKDKANELKSKLEDAAKLAPQVLPEERISAIVTLLKSAAGEQIEVENDPELAKAVLLVNGLSSLSGDVAKLIAKDKAPSVNNLLIELQHQIILLEHAKTSSSLSTTPC